MITYLTKEKYLVLTKKYRGEHWTLGSIEARWEYHSRVIELIKSLYLNDPKDILEMGTMGVSCVENSDTIDYLERWNFLGKQPTYVHDARIAPWPIENRRYELFIALRVFQHLTPFQKESVKEAMRIAKKVIIVVPDTYWNKELPKSRGITYMDFVNFLDGRHPNVYIPMPNESIYYWDVENPTKINLEGLMRPLKCNNQQTQPPKKQDGRNNKRSLFRKILSFAGHKVEFNAGEILTALFKNRHLNSKKEVKIHIEFIGPAGVGKTTIYEEVRKYLRGKWYFKEDLVDESLNRGSEGSNETYNWQLLYGKIKYLNNYELDAYHKIKLVRYFSNYILKDLKIVDNTPSRRFFLDEGLCHNFSEELMSFSDAELKKIMAERALVFVQARSSVTLVGQIRKREKEHGQIVSYHVGLSDDELINYVDLDASRLSMFVERVAVLGIPVCNVFVEDGLDNNVKKILEFEKKFFQPAKEKL